MTMVSLGPAASAPPVARGDLTVIFGPGGPTAEALAAQAGTISYELATALAPRVARRFVP